MTALKKTIPTLIEDEKERKKAMREADKIIYELEQSERLEKKGNINAAADRKQNAAKIAEPFNSTLAKLAQDKTRDAIAAQGHEADFLAKNAATAASERSSNFAARLRLQGDQAHAAASAANAAAARDANNFNKAQDYPSQMMYKELYNHLKSIKRWKESAEFGTKATNLTTQLNTLLPKELEVLPEFKHGKYAQGINQALDVLFALAKGEYNEKTYRDSVQKDKLTSGLIGLVIILVVLFFVIRRGGGGGTTFGGRRGGPGFFYFGGFGGGFGGGSSGGGGGFGGFGGGSFGGGGSGGSW
jgi:hypothetical protein